jgi:hypothetical protein
MLLIFSCIESQRSSFDHTHYLKALQDPLHSLVECTEILDDDIQGECLLFAATEGGYGSEACTGARSEKWKEACFFEVIDKKGVPKHQAKDSCARTGRFRNRCVYHIIQRDEQVLMQRFSIGKEQELSAFIQTEITVLGGEELTHDPLSQTLVSRIVARRFRKEWNSNKNLRFPAHFCGTSSAQDCTRAYRFVVRLGKTLPSPCLIPPPPSVLKESEIPMWEERFHSSAIQVWSELCAQKR